jgi:predicted XRE-type DNA-binding protein
MHLSVRRTIVAERVSRARRVPPGDENEAITASSGNVFAELELPDADELAAKADLARAIREIIESRGLCQREAAPLVGVSQPDLSNLYRRRLEGFSIERLSRMLTALGQDVRIVVVPKPATRKVATLRALVRASVRSSA